jgi:hypothetical protein
MSVWGDAKEWMRRYDMNGAFSGNYDADHAPNGEMP